VSSWRGVWPRECVARCVAARADAANSPPPPIMHIAWVWGRLGEGRNILSLPSPGPQLGTGLAPQQVAVAMYVAT